MDIVRFTAGASAEALAGKHRRRPHRRARRGVGLP